MLNINNVNASLKSIENVLFNIRPLCILWVYINEYCEYTLQKYQNVNIVR